VRRRDLARGALSLVPAMALPLPAWSAGSFVEKRSVLKASCRPSGDQDGSSSA